MCHQTEFLASFFIKTKLFPSTDSLSKGASSPFQLLNSQILSNFWFCFTHCYRIFCWLSLQKYIQNLTTFQKISTAVIIFCPMTSNSIITLAFQTDLPTSPLPSCLVPAQQCVPLLQCVILLNKNQILLLHCSKWLFISLWKSQSSMTYNSSSLSYCLSSLHSILFLGCRNISFHHVLCACYSISPGDSLPLDTCKDYSVISCRFVSKWYILKIVIFTIEISMKKNTYFFFAWFSLIVGLIISNRHAPSFIIIYFIYSLFLFIWL